MPAGYAIVPTVSPGNEVDTAMLTGHAHRTIAELTEKLNTFSRLEPDWDTYGALPPTVVAQDAARQLLTEIVPIVGEKALGVSISPLPNGGVLFEWEGKLAILEVEATPEGSFDLLIEQRVDADFDYTSNDHVSIDEIAQQLNIVLSE
jgi:hypothetical protein